MPPPFTPLSLAALAERLSAFRFTRAVGAVHLHHTWRPRQADYVGARTVEGMWRFHTGENGWSDIAQHLTVAPDGVIWTGRDWDRAPASAAGHNAGAFMLEAIGDFDRGRERLAGAQRAAVVGAIALVQRRLGLAPETLRFHRDFTAAKSCPGTGVVYAELLDELRAAHAAPLAPAAPAVLAGGGAVPARRERGFAAAAVVPAGMSRAPFDASEVVAGGDGADAGDAESSGAAAAVPDEWAEPACDAGVAPAVGLALRGGLGADDLALLRRHVINLRQGRLSGGGALRTTAADVDRLFGEWIPAAAAAARARGGAPLRLLFYAHGGLVAEEAGLAAARALVPWWLEHGVYPVYFVWETGLWETITQLVRGRRELAAAPDLADVTDRALEIAARAAGGGRLWDGMKHAARSASEAGGGALLAAERLAVLCRREGAAVELHAVGHSAGAIFHAHFVPAALDAGAPGFATMSLLAPALRVDEFLGRLAPRLAAAGDGAGGGVRSLALYALRAGEERADSCGRVYRKSLLYLVSNALEPERGARLLGLEESVRAEPRAMRLFGLDGRAAPGAHAVVWAPGPGSGARTHGAFDGDRLTMEGVLRRVLGLAADAPVRPFPAEAERVLRFDLAGGVEREPAVADLVGR